MVASVSIAILTKIHTFTAALIAFWVCVTVSHKPPPLCVVVRVKACGSHYLFSIVNVVAQQQLRVPLQHHK